MQKEKNRTYNGWLVSNNFFKRAIAVWLHSLFIQAIITFLLVFVILTWAFI
jgi:hypothetical protein